MSFPLVQFLQIVYWLALATWFGGVVFIAVSAPIILRTVRESDPTLPTVLSVNMEGQHGTLLGGMIVSNLVTMLLRVELVCAAVLAATIAAQWAYHVQDWPAAFIRTACYLGAVVLAVYDWRVVWPRITKAREQYIEHADEPEIANPARDQFNRSQRESMLLLMLVVAALLGVIVFSATISPARLLINLR
ncbi:MAG TPA: hypothetical protein VLJ39_20835 [Tepidisphaeraceae bacterium]|nr:hypothetical protein [Tepidisphaeraceae bacterium]